MKVTELTEGYTRLLVFWNLAVCPVRSEHTEIAIILPQIVGKTMKSVSPIRPGDISGIHDTCNRISLCSYVNPIFGFMNPTVGYLILIREKFSFILFWTVVKVKSFILVALRSSFFTEI